ncbi:hypothetical protein A4X03_0g8617 [Tilletia caries]|uniref:Uncharacterized protein n=1 Tax=Tilletia caries TaxID=13290 RepID=A0A8T8SGW7_9BASI|nr:hypothetical protein A4X03_0g8617 [Tilletia caries]
MSLNSQQISYFFGPDITRRLLRHMHSKVIRRSSADTASTEGLTRPAHRIRIRMTLSVRRPRTRDSSRTPHYHRASLRSSAFPHVRPRGTLRPISRTNNARPRKRSHVARTLHEHRDGLPLREGRQEAVRALRTDGSNRRLVIRTDRTLAHPG